MRPRVLVWSGTAFALFVGAWALAGPLAAAIAALTVLAVEALAALVVLTLRPGFQWLVTLRHDAVPTLNRSGLKKFLADGYDAELGWVRRPDTSHAEVGQGGKPTRWHTDATGARATPEHEGLPTSIACYGDSFTFARQVDDQETWAWHLAELTGTHVRNFGVGNYGLDQAILRLRREHPARPARVVVMGVVPDTISRILSAWKHYYEYGNTFAFKPRFRLDAGKLVLEPNPASTPEAYEDVRRLVEDVRPRDDFYHRKFLRDAMAFPFSASILADPARNLRLVGLLLRRAIRRTLGRSSAAVEQAPMGLIMRVNLRWRLRLYREAGPTELLHALIEEFVQEGARAGFTPVLAFLPQKDDVVAIQEGGHFYAHVVERARARIHVYDGHEALADRADLDDLYSDDTAYGGHLSPAGNQLIATSLHRSLKDAGII